MIRTVPMTLTLAVVDHFRRRFSCLKLCAYFLQARSKRFNLLLLACDRRFLLLVLAVSLRNSFSNIAFPPL
jgi:hypothetical protein